MGYIKGRAQLGGCATHCKEEIPFLPRHAFSILIDVGHSLRDIMERKRKVQPVANGDDQPTLSKRLRSAVTDTTSQHLFRVDGLIALITGGGTGECQLATTMDERPH